MDVTGTIKEIFKTQKVSEKFKKRDFVITDNSSQYPQHIIFQLTQDRCGLIDGYGPGDEIKVHFNLKGREWHDHKNDVVKYFNQLEAWRIEGKKGYNNPDAAQDDAYNHPGTDENIEDPLPF